MSVDNDILDWSWQLTVSLDQPSLNEPTRLSPNSSISTTVIDDEGTVLAKQEQQSSCIICMFKLLTP